MAEKMRFHVTSLPHTQTTREYSACAYTQKARRFCDMMKSLGHTIYLYASEENEAACDELITVAPKEKQREWFGDNNFHSNFFNITWMPNDAHWVESNDATIREIQKRIEPKDFICIIGGACQKQIADAFPGVQVVEYGIGYEGVFAPYKVFESYAHMHYIYGLNHVDNGQFYDCVIPNYFDPNEFKFSADKEDYFVWLGRFIPRKGPEIAVEATKRIGAKLVMAGQGAVQEGHTVRGEGVFELHGDHIEHIGHVNVEQRAELLSKAKGVFMPTTYLEPFGGVSIEALFCGTPVIATDFGAFTETIPHGVAGYRFRTIGEAAEAASNVDKLDPYNIYDYAMANFSTDIIRFRYQDYFEQLHTLYGEGFYSDWHGSLNRYERYV